MPELQSTSLVPRKTAFAILSILFVFLVLPHVPGLATLPLIEPAQVLSAFALTLPTRRLPAEKVAPVVAVTAPVVPVLPVDSVPNLNVPPGSLKTFFTALRAVEQKKPGAVVRVLHYGDSPTTADSITADARALLQQRFGDAGHGFVLPAKPWAWYGHRGIGIEAKGWQIEAASMHRAADKEQGLGGVNFIGMPGAYSRIRLQSAGHTRVTVHFLYQPSGGTITLLADETELGTIDTYADLKKPGFAEFPLPDGTKSIELRVNTGKPRIFGYRFDKPGPGVQYSSLGINGAQVEMLVRSFQKDDWALELRHEHPDLLVLNYGTNESIFPAYIDKQYPDELRTVLQRLKEALPETSILVMSPMDRGELDATGAIVTPEPLLKLVETQKRIAAEQGCAFFNTFEAMGGRGTMGRWYNEEQPRLVSADFMHPLPAGAAKVGALLEEALLKSYEAGVNR